MLYLRLSSLVVHAIKQHKVSFAMLPIASAVYTLYYYNIQRVKSS